VRGPALAFVGVMLGAIFVASLMGAAGAPREDASTTSAALAGAADAASRMPRLHSLLISRRGVLVLERYFHGARVDRLANVKSASKSIVSALVGIAIERGFISGVDQPIAAFFPELASDPAKGAITIEDLLTMRSGLESTSNRNYGAWVQSGNWVRYALTRQLLEPPGVQMRYSTGNTHLLSAILTKVTKQSTWQFAQTTLARPLGFSLAPWMRDPQGVFFGGNDMQLTPRQMLAFGELYRNGGRLNGQTIVPARWVQTSLEPRTVSPRNGQGYGYGWWSTTFAGHETHFAWGFGGQYIFIIPELDLTIVTTSSTTVDEERRANRAAIFALLEDLILPAVRAEG
jgi:CubicO group peptidase (beta-lactamase class C family)